MRPLRSVAASVLLAIVATTVAPRAAAQDGTTTTSPDPVDAQVVGTTVGASGEPLGSVPVVVHATDTGSDGGLLFLPFFFVATLGFGMLACITGACVEEEADQIVDRTTTGPDGRYAATLPESFVPGRETDTDWIVRATLPTQPHQRMGPTSNFEFEVNTSTQASPPLPLWDVDPEVEVEGWAVSVDGTGGPRELGDQKVHLVADHGALELVGSHGVFDARLLEVPAGADPAMGVMTEATSDIRVQHDRGRTIYHQRVRSAVLPVELEVVPPSRGAPCRGQRADGQEAVVSGPAGCTATDGDLTHPMAPPVEDGGGPAGGASPGAIGEDGDTVPTTVDPATLTSVTTELAAPLDLGLVVVRDAGTDALVEASADGTTWARLSSILDTTVPDHDVVLATPRQPIVARYVRVTDPEGLRAAEISSWEVVPGAVAGAPAPGVAPADPTVRGPLGEDGAARGPWAAAALVLLIVVGRRVLDERRRTTSRPLDL